MTIPTQACLADTLPIGVRRTLDSAEIVITSINLAVEEERPWRMLAIEGLVTCFGHLNRRSQLPKCFPGDRRDCQFWIEPAVPLEN